VVVYKGEIMELTAEQKVTILTSQRKVLAAQVAVNNAQKNLETSHTEYTQLVTNLVGELKLNPSEQQLDLEALEIKDVQKLDKV
jgi:hypothetical protein